MHETSNEYKFITGGMHENAHSQKSGRVGPITLGSGTVFPTFPTLATDYSILRPTVLFTRLIAVPPEWFPHHRTATT